MIRIAVLGEHAAPASATASALRAQALFEVTEVFGGPAALSSPAGREALAAAQVLVYVAEHPVEALPWPELRPAAGQALVILDMTGQLGPERAVALGARGYIGPDEPEEVWTPRLLAAAEGKLAFPPGSIAALRDRARQAAREAWGIDRLTAKQKQLMRWNAQGLSVKQMARRLRVSETAVRNRFSRIRKKLGVDTQEELASVAGQTGLVEGEEASGGPKA